MQRVHSGMLVSLERTDSRLCSQTHGTGEYYVMKQVNQRKTNLTRSASDVDTEPGSESEDMASQCCPVWGRV